MKPIIIDEINNSIIYSNVNGKQKLKSIIDFRTNEITVSDYNVVIIKTDNNVINFVLSYDEVCNMLRQYK